MLDKRVQVLFDRRDYQLLEEAAREEAVSVGELVRSSVKRRLAVRRRDSLKRLQDWRRKFVAKIRPKITREEIMEWVKEGRKYEFGG